MKSQNRIAALDELFLEVGTYRNTNDYKELLNFIRQFPHIAPFNAMLVHVQRPGSTFVATADYWYGHGRKIRPGANPIVILRPFGPVAFVFDAGDTTGDGPIPEEVISPFAIKGAEIPLSKLQLFIDSIKGDGVLVYPSEMGTQMAGYIQARERYNEISVIRGNVEYIVKNYYDLVVNQTHDNTERLATMAHELGHLYCGHLGSPSDRLWRNRSLIDTQAKEFEAESVCWLVCERLGIHNPSAEYLSGYMPEGYKHFSKTKPMKLEHFAPVIEWWNNRQEINEDGFDKAKEFTAQQLSMELGYNFDQCGYPHEEEEILDPMDLIQRYEEQRTSLNAEIDRVLAEITAILGGAKQ